MTPSPGPIHVVGGGLAGSEAALQLARLGLDVVMHEMRPERSTPAHETPHLAEIVCSNSLKSTAASTASGLLKFELEALGCRLLALASRCAVPAGAALAVDREAFSAAVEEAVDAEPRIDLVRAEVTELPDDGTRFIVASGPLTSDALREAILARAPGEALHFYDAIAPTVTLASLDSDVLFRAARYERGDADYWNAPLDRTAYESFVAALVDAEKADVASFDRTELFDGCLPVEEIASRGRDTLAFGPLRPVGLRDPRDGRRPHAVVQLRQENAAGTLFGLVGFQTRLRQGEQRRVFRMIPGLEKAEFVRYGQLHRNLYLDSPRVLDRDFAALAAPRLHFAGQITGVEGYVESILSGLWTAWRVAALERGLDLPAPPSTTLLGALLDGHLFDATAARFTPMNVNFGLLPPVQGLPRGRKGRQVRKEALTARSRADLDAWLAEQPVQALLAASGGRC